MSFTALFIVRVIEPFENGFLQLNLAAESRSQYTVETIVCKSRSMEPYGRNELIMTRRPTADELKPFFNQLHQLESSILTGARRLEEVRPVLQEIIEGKFHRAKGTVTGFPGWYISPEEQVSNVHNWNRLREWGLDMNACPSLDVVSNFEPQSPLEVPVLAVYLPDRGRGKSQTPGYVRTASELWHIARNRQPNSWQRGEFNLDADHLRLLEGTEEAHEPGIRWVMVDLGAHWGAHEGIRPCDVRSKDSAHAEVLAAAAHFPGWIAAINGIDVPHVWLPGYQATIPGKDAWTYVPVLYWNSMDRRVNLSASWDARRYWYYAIPVRREL